MRVWLVVLLVAGCGSSSGGNDGGPVDLASGVNDVERCQTACAKMISCGVDYDSVACNSGCLQAPAFLPCIRLLPALDDCNALAMCDFKEYGHDFCGGTSGVPAGSAGCNDTATCEASCNAMGAAAPCSCNCIALASPSVANALVVNNQCAIAKCSGPCSPAGSGTACNTCAAMMCGTEHGVCASQ